MESINEELLPGNTCFGCGKSNQHGLKIRLKVNQKENSSLTGLFEPPSHMTGFPGVTHGGAIYTALDCLAAWTPTALKREIKAIWVTGLVHIKYINPAHEGQIIYLESKILQDNGKSIIVETLAKNNEDQILARAEFTMIPVPPDKFIQISGIQEFPIYWKKLLDLETGQEA